VTASTNPVFGPNKLKIGTFGLNGKGSAHTLVPEAYKPTWSAALAAAQLADRAGYEAIVAYARWKGYIPGKASHPSGNILDPFTFCAGIAQATDHSAVFATSHAPTMHPLVAAKQCATVDLICGGRFALNVVAGWNQPELEMFGAPFREHAARYQHLSEWLSVVERLWSESEEFDFHGEFFHLSKAVSLPKPVQTPRPPIMSAGGSEIGRRFACQRADLCFILLHREDPGAWATQIAEYKTFAREEFGRNVQVWTLAPVVQRDTMAEALAYVQHYAVDRADEESVNAWIAGHQGTAKGMSDELRASMRRHFAAGGGGYHLVGTPDSIAEKLACLSDAGLDGILFTWADFADGLNRFNRDVMPLLEARGLRRPFVKLNARAS
jgi:alkanesulfonate monooxygenase SsuD/methylene tetrahydromethanopterin reductase-like flavin-dependent oxidoreductase (luciferase family)